MPKYLVKGKILHDHQEYGPGDTIELTEAQAAAMPWAVGGIMPSEDRPAAQRLWPTGRAIEPAGDRTIEPSPSAGSTHESMDRPPDEPISKRRRR